jgi:hypothetical protein
MCLWEPVAAVEVWVVAAAVALADFFIIHRNHFHQETVLAQ